MVLTGREIKSQDADPVVISNTGDFDGGQPDSNYGGIVEIDAGGV